ncbi:MAG: ImmA/IrrE family metallo-endopeptidase, partial [Candidatus Erginobacter occultus]|nr:ImmA/IrrE family metallo-endopeptidase [Candidatus Erginobacter occultus]
MTRPWESYLGNQPALYARKVLKDCGLREPPFCERTVVDYLGLEIRELNHRNVPAQFRGILNNLKTACSWLKRVSNGNSLIYLYGDTITERKRLSVFHECGHFIIPWHEGYNHSCTENEIESPTRKRIEREAFGCGNEFLMPMESFVRDGQSLEIGIPAIEQLRERYVSSLEATAIWYAFTFPGPC